MKSSRNRRHRRQGTTTVEFALTCPILFLLIFGIMVGASGTFRYQQVASLAREGARWASVHGGQYAQETGKSAATAGDIYASAIEPHMVGLDPGRLSYQVTWNKNNMPLTVVSDYGAPIGNTVSVTVTYQWFPESILNNPISLTSTATAQMAY